MNHPQPDLTVDGATFAVEERHLNAAWLFATAVFIAALALYVATMCRTVFWWDTGELAANARVLGIAHRPGFPLYILVGRVFGLLPFGDYFYRINFISALSAAVSLAVMGYLISRLNYRWLKTASAGETFAPVAAALVAVAGTYSYWIQAVRAEVYAPNLVIIVLLLVCAWRADSDRSPGSSDASRWICAAGFLAGLGMAIHHATLVSILPAVVLFLWVAGRRRRVSGWVWVATTFLFVMGMTVYLYLPIRAAQNPPLNWGWVTGSTAQGWSAVAATDSYKYIAETTLSSFLRNVSQLGGLLVDQFQWGLILLALLGLITWWRAARRWAILALGMIVGNVLMTALLVTDFSETNTDIHGYLLPALAAFALLIAGGGIAFWRLLVQVGQRLMPTRSIRRTLWVSAGFMVVLLIIAPAIINAPFCNLSQNRLAYEFGSESIAYLRPGAVVFLAGTNWDFVLRGLRYVSNWRPDLTVLNRDLLPADWYRTWVFRRHPRLAGISIPTDSTGRPLWGRWGQKLAAAGYPVYWEFTERDFRLVPSLVPGGHLFELLAQPVDVLGQGLLEQQEEFERNSLFYSSPERVRFDYDAKMIWVTNLYRAGMYYESRGLLGRAKNMYKRALSVKPDEEAILTAYQRTDPEKGLLGPLLRLRRALSATDGTRRFPDGP